MASGRQTFVDGVKTLIGLVPELTLEKFGADAGFGSKQIYRKLNGNAKLFRNDVIAIVVELARCEAIETRSQARYLLGLMDIPDMPANLWKNDPLKKLKNDDSPESGTSKEQPQVPVTGQVADKPATAPDKPQEQPTPAVPHTTLNTQSSGETNLQPSPQTLPALPRRLKRIVTHHKWAIVVSVILAVALVTGSSFIVWNLFFKAPTFPAVSWGPTRAITCDDLFNPPPLAPPSDNIAECTPTSDGHVTLGFSILKQGYPEWDVKEGRGPSGPTYRVTLRLDLSPTTGVPHIAGCVVMDTRPDETIGEVVCVHNSGLIEVLDAVTMCKGCVWRHLENGEVRINDPANVPVVVERVDNKLYIEVADQVIQPVDLTTAAGNIGFLAVGTQGSLQMSAIDLA